MIGNISTEALFFGMGTVIGFLAGIAFVMTIAL